MPTRSSVGLIIGSTIDDPGSPEEVTQCMGREPTEILWSELHSEIDDSGGFQAHKTWLWTIQTPLDDSHPPLERLSALIELLLPLRTEILAIPERYWRHVQCNYDSTPRDFNIMADWGLIVSPRDLGSLSDMELALCCESRVWEPKSFEQNLLQAEQAEAQNPVNR